MGLLSKQKAERKKYIYPTDFINLIAFTSNEVVEDVVSYLINNDFEQKANSYHIDGHLRITQNDHNNKFGFDLNTRKFLDECYVSSFFTKYVSYNAMLEIDSNFYYLIEEIQSIDCIKELNLNFSSINEVRKAVNVWNKEIDNPIYRNDKGSFDQPNYCQSKLIKQNIFSVIEAACLLAGTSREYIEQYTGHPRFIELYSDYVSYKLMIELAIENDELYFLDGTIETVILQKYLFNAGYIIKGFNDWLTIEPAKPLIGNKPNEQLEASNNELNEAQIKIADLKNQLSQAKAELADKPDTIGNDKSLYVTPAIEIMNKVITEFWINYDPNQSAPKQEIIVRWITGNFDGVSKALALNIDKVCRHSEARSGGKYKR